MVWHRNSIGVLVQRFFFAVILLASILTFKNCISGLETASELTECLIKTEIPLTFCLIFVCLKVRTAGLITI